MKTISSDEGSKRAPRLTRAARQRQLLDTALRIVREEGADRLTLGHLAINAGVSKPVVYEHFGTRSGLLIELYRWIDTERVAAFRAVMASGERSADEAIEELAGAYMACTSDLTDEFHAVGAALAGSEEKATVYQELLDNVVDMFSAVLRPYCASTDAVLERLCIGLVGAGEALSEARLRKGLDPDATTATLVALIRSSMQHSGARPTLDDGRHDADPA